MLFMTFPGSGRINRTEMSEDEILPRMEAVDIPEDIIETHRYLTENPPDPDEPEDDPLVEFIEEYLHPHHLDPDISILLRFDETVADAMLDLGVVFTVIHPNQFEREEFLTRTFDGNHMSPEDRDFLEANWEPIFDYLNRRISSRIELGPGQLVADVI